MLDCRGSAVPATAVKRARTTPTDGFSKLLKVASSLNLLQPGAEAQHTTINGSACEGGVLLKAQGQDDWVHASSCHAKGCDRWGSCHHSGCRQLLRRCSCVHH